jgi:hypothetical protein
MSAVINDVRSIAASGTAAPVIQVAQDAQLAVINVSATYAAVSATASGLQATFSLSRDGGTTYTASATPAIVAAPAAAGSATAQQIIRFGDDPYRLDGDNHPDHIRINLTNLDGTNAVESVVVSNVSSHVL